MQDLTFQQFSDLIHQKSGIFLTPEKKTLLIGRIRSRMQNLNISSYESYLNLVKKDVSGKEQQLLINSIATHHTFFFREKQGLDAAVHEIKRRVQLGQYKLRIWCAASSSGEEPYSLAMMLHETFGERMTCLDIRILATDISSRILEVAQRGQFTTHRVESISKDLKDRYFDRSPTNRDLWIIKSRLREMVRFRYLNLCQPPLPFHGPIDVILCRNVMIYFDAPTIQGLIGRFEKVLAPHGLCVIGATETIREMNQGLTFESPAIFRKTSITPAPHAVGSKSSTPVLV